MHQDYIYEFLDTNGDGTGIDNAIGDYSSNSTDFLYRATRHAFLHRMLVTIEDTIPIGTSTYGNGITLTNGIKIFTFDNTTNTELVLSGAFPVITNLDWGSMCYDAEVKTWGVGNEALLVRLSFDKAGKAIEMNAGDTLIIRLNDDFTGLISHKFMVQGHLE